MKGLSFTLTREVVREDLKGDRVFARKTQGDVQSWQIVEEAKVGSPYWPQTPSLL